MFNDQFPATRNAIRRLEQMRAAQASRPCALDEAANDRGAPPPQDGSLPVQASSFARDLVMRLTVEASELDRRLDIAITIDAPRDKSDVARQAPGGSDARLTIAVAIGHDKAPARTETTR